MRFHLVIPVMIASTVALAGCSTSNTTSQSPTSSIGAGSAERAERAERAEIGSSSTPRLADAVRSAIRAAGGGTATGADLQDSASVWEITVVHTGIEHDVHVGSSGVMHQEQEPEDVTDQAEAERRISDAKLDINAAASAIGKYQDGTLTELSLDDHLGTTTWDGTVIAANGATREVRINAANGTLVSNHIDND